MLEFKLKFEHIDSVPMATITEKGIKYSKHDFNAKTTIKDKGGAEIEITVCRRAEREWMLGNSGAQSFINAKGAVIFNLDDKILKAKAEEVYAFLFPKITA